MLPRQSLGHDGVNLRACGPLGLVLDAKLNNPRSVDFPTSTMGPLDMRMNRRERGVKAARIGSDRCRADKLANASIAWPGSLHERFAEQIAATSLAELSFLGENAHQTPNGQLSVGAINVVRFDPDDITEDGREAPTLRARRYWSSPSHPQSVALNDEFTLSTPFSGFSPGLPLPGGRVGILKVVSTLRYEDRRVKHHFRDGLRSGSIPREIRPRILFVPNRPGGAGRNSRARAKMRLGHSR